MYKPLGITMVVEYKEEQLSRALHIPKSAVDKKDVVKVNIAELPEKKESMTDDILELLESLHKAKDEGKQIIIKRNNAIRINPRVKEGEEDYYFIHLDDVYAIDELAN